MIAAVSSKRSFGEFSTGKAQMAIMKFAIVIFNASGSKLSKSTFRVKKGGKLKKNGKNVTFFDFFFKNDLKSCKFRCIL